MLSSLCHEARHSICLARLLLRCDPSSSSTPSFRAADEKIWHVKAIHPEGRLLDLKALDKDGKIFAIKAFQEEGNNHLLDIKALVGRKKKLPVKVLIKGRYGGYSWPCEGHRRRWNDLRH